MPVHHLNTNNPDFYGYEQVGLNANQVRLLPTSQSKNVTATTIDAEDHTLFGAPVEGFEEQTKDNQDKALNSTADLIIKNHGAKKFFLIPEKKIMKDFTPPNEPMVTGQRFDRVLYANVADLRDGASKKVAQHLQLAQQLDEKYQLVVGVSAMLVGRTRAERYKELCSFLKDNANFTPGKMKEYAEGDIVGMQNRYENMYVVPFFVLEKSTGNIVATVRALKTPLSSAAYLSDEVVYTQLLPVEAFQGSYEKSPEDEQRTFLMAYLIDKAMQQGLASFKYFFLIGADGRVHQYCKIGCKRFTGEENFDGFKLVMHFSAPAPRLVEYKEESRKQTITFHNKPSFWQSEQSTQSIAQLDNTVPMQLQN